MAELIVDGQATCVDISALDPARFARSRTRARVVL